MQSIAVTDNAFTFHVIQNLTYFLGRSLAMVQERNELRDCALEVHVVLPQRVVRINEQSLPHEGPLSIHNTHQFILRRRNQSRKESGKRLLLESVDDEESRG